jgi:hypothetical protein
MVVGKLKWGKIPFGPTSKSLSILNYKFQEQIQFETCLNFKWVQTFCKNLINSLKF